VTLGLGVGLDPGFPGLTKGFLQTIRTKHVIRLQSCFQNIGDVSLQYLQLCQLFLVLFQLPIDIENHSAAHSRNEETPQEGDYENVGFESLRFLKVTNALS
jgi:hypothetical protein